MGHGEPTRNLPAGVLVRLLTPHSDARGVFTEIQRNEWNLGNRPVQLNVVKSIAGVLRGVHVHVRHEDYFVLVTGRAFLGLHDLRPWSPTHGVSCLLELSEEKPQAVVTPPGVAHGFYFSEPAVHVYGVSHYWDTADEIAVRWNSPELRLDWPTAAPVLSERDGAAPGYPAFVGSFLRAWEAVHGAHRPGASL